MTLNELFFQLQEQPAGLKIVLNEVEWVVYSTHFDTLLSSAFLVFQPSFQLSKLIVSSNCLEGASVSYARVDWDRSGRPVSMEIKP